jgi:Uncharacterized protein conserved in bacteria (DUF2330)
VLAAALLGGATTPASGCACGIALEAEVAYEEALIVWDGERETVTVKLDLSDAGERAAVLFPLPAEPEIDQIRGRTDLFGYLDEATTPPPPESDDEGVTGAPGGGGGVEVVERRVIGAYDVAVLHAEDEGALADWLAENDYSVAAAADSILGRYVERGWHFAAIKLAEARDGSLKPLQMAFAARRAVYPMELSRLSQVPVSLRLYVNAPRAVSATGIDGVAAVFDSSVDDLEPAPSADVRRLLPEAHLTRLELTRAPAESVRADVGLRLAAATNDGNEGGGGLSAGFWIALAVGGLGVLAAALLWGRSRGSSGR